MSVKLQNVLMQLRKCCNHPYLLEHPINPETQQYIIDESLVKVSGKMKLLDQMLPELKKQGHKVSTPVFYRLCAFCFRKELKIVNDWRIVFFLGIDLLTNDKNAWHHWGFLLPSTLWLFTNRWHHESAWQTRNGEWDDLIWFVNFYSENTMKGNCNQIRKSPSELLAITLTKSGLEAALSSS